MTEAVFEAILNHPSPEVRQSAAKLLATTKEPKVLDRLQWMAMDEGINAEVRAAVRGALDESNLPPTETIGDLVEAQSTRKELDQGLESPGSSILETKTGTSES